ncbi:hypothetical protein BRX43_04595 [Sphingomonas sp. S-NIH.Pt15_0812]|nr:hypothetical protein BRX43_04595 [Sphingomonas sp. S-NIH.Pt15_0812]
MASRVIDIFFIAFVPLSIPFLDSLTRDATNGAMRDSRRMVGGMRRSDGKTGTSGGRGYRNARFSML